MLRAGVIKRKKFLSVAYYINNNIAVGKVSGCFNRIRQT